MTRRWNSTPAVDEHKVVNARTKVAMSVDKARPSAAFGDYIHYVRIIFVQCSVTCAKTAGVRRMLVAGLTMTVNVQQYEYVTQAGDTAGIVVGILPQNQMPFPEDDGIIVSPGHATSIAIVQVKET